MSILRLQPNLHLAVRRASSGGPSCRGGASSVLRVGQPTVSLLPLVRTLAQRMAARAPMNRR
jgi:hypothetical protein